MKTHIEIPVADLKSVLPGLAKVVSKKSSLPVLSCVKVTLNEDRAVQIQANSLDQIVTARLAKSCQGSPGTLLVSYDELNRITKLCSGEDTIELSTTGQETSITYPAAGTRIHKPVTHLGVEEFPPIPNVNTEPVPLDDAFKQALREAFECSSTDNSRYILNGACLDIRKREAHYVVGTNGRHLYSANSFLFDVPKSIIIPSAKFPIWPGFVEDGPWTLRYQPEVMGKGKARVGAQPTWIELDSAHWTYLTKPIEGEYPNWQQVVPTDQGPSRITLDEAGVRIVLEALPLLPGADAFNEPVSLEIAGDNLVLKARGSDKADWSQIPVPAKVSGPSVCISLNRTYLGRALRFGLTEIAIQDPLSALVFSTKGKTMVVMPLGPGTPVATPATTPPAVQPPIAAPAAIASPTSPAENVSAEPPSPAESNHQTESPERNNPMPTNTMTAPQRGNLTSHDTEAAENPAIDEVMAKIDSIKTSLRSVLEELNETDRLLRRAIKERKANDKEINRARTALRSLQAVEL